MPISIYLIIITLFNNVSNEAEMTNDFNKKKLNLKANHNNIDNIKIINYINILLI